MTKQKKLSELLLEVRTKQGLTQAQVARRMDINPSTYTRVERGKQRPASFTLQGLSNALHISLHDILEAWEYEYNSKSKEADK